MLPIRDGRMDRQEDRATTTAAGFHRLTFGEFARDSFSLYDTFFIKRENISCIFYLYQLHALHRNPCNAQNELRCIAIHFVHRMNCDAQAFCKKS